MIKDAPEDLAQVLSLRQQLTKSSVKKYQAMQNAACIDHRTRGMFQFYGANRTGRWDGRLIQLQNLPQNHMDDLDAARELVRIGDYDVCPCIGKHVRSTAQIGKFVLLGTNWDEHAHSLRIRFKIVQ